MPIYEYVCRNCDARFEELIRDGEALTARCPECGTLEVNRLLSLFATTGESSTRPAATASDFNTGNGHRCGCGGSCGCGNH